MSVLDLPIEKQKEIAKRCGFSSLEQWQEQKKKDLDGFRKFTASLKMINYNDLSPEDQAAYRRWGEKVASGNPR